MLFFRMGWLTKLVLITNVCHGSWDDFEFQDESSSLSDIHIIDFPKSGGLSLAPPAINLAVEQCKFLFFQI